MGNFKVFFISFLLPILIAIAIDYTILKKTEKEKLSNNTEAENL
jgi:hypothetical protein